MAETQREGDQSGAEDVITKHRASGSTSHYFVGPIRETVEDAEADRRRWVMWPVLHDELARTREETNGRISDLLAGRDLLCSELTWERDELADALTRLVTNEHGAQVRELPAEVGAILRRLGRLV